MWAKIVKTQGPYWDSYQIFVIGYMWKLWTGHNEHFAQTQGGNYFYSIYLNREAKNRTLSAATQNGSLSVYAIKPKGALECTRVSDDILRWILTVVVHTGTLSEASSEGILTRGALKRDCCIRRELSVVGAHKQNRRSWDTGMKEADLMKESALLRRCSTLLGGCAAQMQSLRRYAHKQWVSQVHWRCLEWDGILFSLWGLALDAAEI